MKKAIIMLCMTMSLFAMGTFAQEVRGVETRIVEYEGDEYTIEASDDDFYNRKEFTFSEYYGFELTNKNSIPVSVSVEIYRRGAGDEEDKLRSTKEIVLKSGESYIMKNPKLYKYEKFSSPHIQGNYRVKLSDCEKNGKMYAGWFYVKYKAFKLQ